MNASSTVRRRSVLLPVPGTSRTAAGLSSTRPTKVERPVPLHPRGLPRRDGYNLKAIPGSRSPKLAWMPINNPPVHRPPHRQQTGEEEAALSLALTASRRCSVERRACTKAPLTKSGGNLTSSLRTTTTSRVFDDHVTMVDCASFGDARASSPPPPPGRARRRRAVLPPKAVAAAVVQAMRPVVRHRRWPRYRPPCSTSARSRRTQARGLKSSGRLAAAEGVDRSSASSFNAARLEIIDVRLLWHRTATRNHAIEAIDAALTGN